jgi:photosystem II stability/assembly factor-like uncharacterized protein
MVSKRPRLFIRVLLPLLLWHGLDARAQMTVRLLTTNSIADNTWGVRNSTTTGGKVLWIDGSGSVIFFNGTTTNLVQLQGLLGSIENTVFALGSGETPSQVIGVWRHGTDSGWVSVNGGTPVPVMATNPINPAQPLNAEGVAVAEGSVFMVLQAGTSKHVFRVDPVSGQGIDLTGNAVVPGAQGRISTSQGQAVWPFLDNTNNIFKLHFYDGSKLELVDTNIQGEPDLAQGRIVYLKPVGGANQVFLYDSTVASPTPVQVTSDLTGTDSFPRTDGAHIAWLHTAPGSTNADIFLYGGIQLTGPGSQVPTVISEFNEHPFQLDRAQMLWEDVSNRLEYYAGAGPYALDISPCTNFAGPTCCVPWLTDGFAAWTGLSSSGGSNREVFLMTVAPPSDARQPLPPLLLRASPASNQVTLTWDRIIGAASYNLYFGYDPAISKDNYRSVAGGTRITNISSPFTVGGLTNRVYFFAVSAVQGAIEGPTSLPTLVAVWAPVAGAPLTNYYAVAAGLTNGAIAYASGGRAVFETTNGGASWTALAGGIQGLDVRALAVDGARVYAATRDIVGPAQILRSLDGGTSWVTVVANGGQLGEQNKVIAIDPVSPARLYAADFQLPSYNGLTNSYVIYSTDGGTNWSHLPAPTTPGAEIRAYSLAINPLNPSILYAAGTGTPNLVRSTNGGANWIDVDVGPGFAYGLAIDPVQPQDLYTGAVAPTGASRGLLKSTNSGSTWTPGNAGFPSPLPLLNSPLIDPLNSQQIHAGTDMGYYISLDGGQHWTAANSGLNSLSGAQYISALALTASRQLLAATGNGIYRLDLSTLNLTVPTVTMARSGGAATLSWPATANGFVAELATNLNAPVWWTTLPYPVVVTNGRNLITIGLSNAASFYRLSKP